jgi:hypothetical protein
MATANQYTFQGFQFPTTTPIPDEVFDVLMPQLSGAELKVLLYICRRTFGFKKESDTISLHQIATGIKTRDGRVLDGGTGLCKRHVQRALKVLEKKNVIQVTRKVDETGLNEVNTYSLNMLNTSNGVGTKSPHPRDKMSPGVGTPVSTTTNSNQETVLQETDIVVAVTQDLENFGIAKSAATKLIHHYPAEYIRGKVAMVQRLVAAGSCLVSQNPAGWLRKAIEEDYSPPRNYQRQRQRHVREARNEKVAHIESREQYMAIEESQQAQNVPTQPEQTVAPPRTQLAQTVLTTRAELVQTVPTEREQNVSTETAEWQQNVSTRWKQNVGTHNRENIPEKKETEKTVREHETTWNKALENLQADLPREEVAARLTGTTLIEVTDTAARIGVPNPNALAWLERRMYGQISKAMKGVVGKDLDLQFVAAP